jgi:hypothetical protein
MRDQGLALSVFIVLVSVFVVVPSGVVTVSVFLISAFLSQPTNPTAKLSTMQTAMKRFIVFHLQ